MTTLQLSLLFLAAVLTGIVNSVAGGGSFFAVPAMIFCGIPPVLANTNGTVVVWLGSALCIGAYRSELAKIRPALIIWLVGTSLVGGMVNYTQQPCYLLRNWVTCLLRETLGASYSKKWELENPLVNMEFDSFQLSGECVTILHEPMRTPVQTFCV